MRRHFHKMHGLGNDFVILDARETPFDVTPALAKAIADRRTGVGCDQLIVLEPSATADLKMRIWNTDGGEVESCGNATRCVVQLTGARTIETDGGLLEGTAEADEVEVVLPRAALCLGRNSRSPTRWTPRRCRWPGTVSKSRSRSMSAIRTSCFFVADAREVALDQLGPRIENDPAFPERINVNVATWVRRPPETADLRTRRRRNAGLRDRRLRERGRRDRHQARAIPGASRHDRRQSDDQLGAGRADPDARHRDPRVRGRARPRTRCNERRDDHASAAGSISPRARRSRARRPPTRTGSSSTAAR